MPSYFVTSDPDIVSPRVIHVPVSGVAARMMQTAFIDAIGISVQRLEEKRGRNFKFYEGRLAGGGRIAFIPVAMLKDVLHAAGVISWY